MKDPSTGQILVFSSAKTDGSTDPPAIASLPNVHADCLSIQLFPKNDSSSDPSPVVLALTMAYQPSAMIPQVSDLQETSQLAIDMTIDISLIDNNDSETSQGQTSCTTYPIVVPVSYDPSVQMYVGVFDVPPPSSGVNSITVTGSSTIQNPIILSLVDSQGNPLPSVLNLNNGNPFNNLPQTSISKMKLQATAAADAPMDPSLNVTLLICPTNNIAQVLRFTTN